MPPSTNDKLDPRSTLVTAQSERRADPSANDRLCLLVLGNGLVATHPLPESGEAVIGRSEKCDVQIDDRSISRRHAVLRLGPPLQIEDLGSANGTRVHSTLIRAGEPTTLNTDEVVELGTVLLIVQRRPESLRPLRLWSHDYFEGRLDDEYTRAARAGSSFALVRIHCDHNLPAGMIQLAFASIVGPLDVVGLYAPGEYEVLLSDRTPEQADDVADRLASQLGEGGARIRVGVASYPRDGRNPEALVACACAIARGERDAGAAGGPVVVPEGTMQNLQRLVERIAAGTISVLILGETGVGKGVFAETVHRLSPRAAKRFLAINCAALAESLLESELFGHERGAFTGAVQTKPGLLETAEGGTVFLDEIGELPPSLQVKLLRVIEERQVLRVGSVRSRPIDVRFVAATNRDLETEVAVGRFRQDLYFRLNGVSLVIPPLRERVSEIPGLARAFVAQACKQAGRKREPEISSEAMTLLERYSWPGNIRELRNVIERAVLLCIDGPLLPEHLPVEKMSSPFTARPIATDTPIVTPRMMGGGHPVFIQRAQSTYIPGGEVPLAGGPFAGRPPFGFRASATGGIPESFPPTAALPFPPAGTDGAAIPGGVRSEMAALERARILDALQQCAGNQTQAAKLLGMSRRTLVTRLDAYGILRPRKGRGVDEE